MSIQLELELELKVYIYISILSDPKCRSPELRPL